MELVKYEAACRAVAEARTIDEVKEIANRAEAARAYAKQAKNRELELDASEIRVRAERRLGEILLELKQQNKFGYSTITDHTGHGGKINHPPLTLSDLGIDHNISSAAQRLAKLPVNRFDDELVAWRSHAETAQRIESPLQSYRKPSIRADRQRSALRLGRKRIEAKDCFDKYRAPDGRRFVDWRAGELVRIMDLAMRVYRCAEQFKSQMPVANPDPLATMEMIFRSETLLSIIEPIWESPVDCGDAGLNKARIDAARVRRSRRCENCDKEFVARNPSGKARAGKSNEGRFCSRKCAHEAARKPKH